MIGPSDSFIWGSGGAQLTPSQIDAQRKVAQALMAQGSDYSPVQSWTQGASRVAQAIFGGMQARDATEAAKSNMAAEAKVLASLPSLISGDPSASGVGATPSISRPMGRLSIPAQSDKIYSNDEPSPLDPPSGADRDAAIRTVLAEAADQGPVGMNAVASVIRNRAVNGGYGGDTPTGVVTAPNQFEPWNTAAGRGRMAAIDPNGSQYAAAGRAIDSAYAGNDPTNGATMFYGPQAQASLGRQPPAWDNGAGVDIGGHRFFGGVAPQPTRVAMADPTTTTDGKPMAFAGQPATAPPQQVAQASPVETGGGVQSTPGFVAAPTVSPALLRASMDQRFSEGTRKILGSIVERQLEAQIKRSDPLYQMQVQEAQGKLGLMPLDAESKRLAIEEARNKLTPLGAPTVDGQGNLVQKDALGKVNMLRPAPNAPSDVAAYNFYADQEAKSGREPKPFEVWDLSRRRSSATSVNNNIGGGSDKQVFDTFAENTKEARAAATGLTALRNARQAIQGSGGVITGAGAEGRLMLQKVGAAFGVVDPTAIQNTETFRAAIAPQVAAVMKSTVGTTNISNSDREFAQQAAGGSIKLDAGSITRLLDIMERADIARLELHQKQLDAVYPDPEKNRRERALFGVQTPEAPDNRSKVESLLQKYGPR